MIHFVHNIVIGLWVFFGWYLVGLGPSIALLPRYWKHYAFLLAPLMGMSLLVLVNLFQITVLLIPLMPRFNLVLLLMISVLLLWTYRKETQLAWHNFCRHGLTWFWLPSFTLLLVFAWLFHNDGYHLLVGGSDQLQYCQNARQILEEMHTNSALDVPLPRQDHFVYDIATRLQPYWKSYRRGAEVMLASVTSVTGLSFEEAFPVTILSGLLTLGLILSFIGRIFLRLSFSASLLAQVTILASFYLLLFHIQGSLALIIGLAPGLVSLALLSRASSKFSWDWIILTSIIVAAYFSIYSEPALFNIIAPSILLILIQFLQSRSKGFIAIRNLFIVYLIAFICAPIAFDSVIANVLCNLKAIYSELNTVSTPSIIANQPIQSGESTLELWKVSAVIFGAMSYYDLSNFNSKIGLFISDFPRIGEIVFFMLCCCGLLGYLKAKTRLALLFGSILITWSLSSLVLAHGQDSLRMTRSLHYSMPFACIGIVILASHFNFLYKNKIFWNVASWLARVLLISFIFTNVYTNARTIDFVTSHNFNDDPILIRYNENAANWKMLHDELRVSASHDDAPVLLSGFSDTVHPVAIINNIHHQSHILGSSINNFWKIYDFNTNLPAHMRWMEYNTHFSEKQFQIALQKNEHWSVVVPRLIKQSIQAAVPVGHDFPIEWADSKDVFAHRIKRFTNICDVVYRNDFAVTLPRNLVSSLKTDNKGQFRTLKTSAPILIHEQINTPHLLVINFDGKIGDIQLLNKNQLLEANIQKNNQQISLAVQIKPEDITKLRLVVSHAVKLRSMTWAPIG